MKYTNLQSLFHSYVLLCQDYCCIVGKFILLFCYHPSLCCGLCPHLAWPFAIYLKHFILGSALFRIVISFWTHRSVCPISILLCLSIMVDCRVDIESSLSHTRWHKKTNHHFNDILPPIDLAYRHTQHSHISVWIAISDSIFIVWRHQLIVVYPCCLITVCTVYPPSIHQRTFQIDTIVAIVTVCIKI